MSNLWVIDVSPVLYTGNTSPRYQERSQYGYPTGGLVYLNAYISNAAAEGGDIVFVYDSPTDRASICSSYKNGRTSNAAVVSHLKLSHDVYTKAGFCVLKKDGYEADDLIYSVVKKYKDNYSNIFIVTNDMDISHNVQPGVEIRACSSNASSVNMENFCDIVHKGVSVTWNTISAYKTFCGCQSDCVKGISAEDGTPGSKLYEEYVSYLREHYMFTYEETTSPDRLCAFAIARGVKESVIKEQISVIFPRFADIEVHETKLNMTSFQAYLALIGDYDSCKRMGIEKPHISQVQRTYLEELKKQLADAPIALGVPKAIPVHTSSLDAFQKDAPW